MIVLGFVDEPVCYILDLRNDFDANSPGATWHSYVVLPEPDTHRGNRECASDMRRAKQWPRECVSDAMLTPDEPTIWCDIFYKYGWSIWYDYQDIYTTVVLPTPDMMPDNHWHPSMSIQTWRNWIAWGMECDQNRD